MRRLVVVSGAGRSGTSTVAGALVRLGLHVPEPHVPADDTNPRGFYESQWVVDFHKRLLDRSPVVRTLDSRPEALELAASRTGDGVARELDTWLAAAGHDQVLVKDPRVLWFQHLWRDAAARAGVRLGSLTMLRHPAEVARSRDTHYVSDQDAVFRRRRGTANVAAWVNVAQTAELVTRGTPRALVRYTDLLSDWRAALAPVAARLDLELDIEDGAAAVDGFVEAGLRRSRPTWEGLDVPDLLRDLAEETWTQVNALVEDPDDAAALTALEGLRVDHARLHDHAVAVALDHTGAREVHVRRNVKSRLAHEHRTEMDALRAELEGRGAARRWGRGRRGRDG